ncbi:hypothetical protein [Providencia stuartii]|uniref:hypothetical protein n=1 Tax=Providencia stuartii TaxID=588 RepID=UPI0018C514E8|nr:hypothetical protein [Providencia stuartii]MBG5921330.1 hypothetical protein [Providencia stuartii]
MTAKKWPLWLFAALSVCLLSACANVRWQHPTPSTEIVQLMMAEIQGARNIDGEEYTVEETFSRLRAQKEIKGTRPFQVITISQNHEITIEGYSEYFDSIGLITDADFARFSIPNKHNIQGYYYSYRGQMVAVNYSLPHMVRDANSKDSLVLQTQPITDYHITVVYLDGTQYPFKYRSTSVSAGMFGRYKSYKNSFDGRFYIPTHYQTGRYELYAPL